MLDINTFIIILKKYPSLVIYDCPLYTKNDFNLLNVLYYSNIKTRNNLIETIDEYINKKKIIEKSFDDGYKYSIYSNPIKSILPIIEKELILVLLHNRTKEYHFEFRLYNLYDIGDNNYLLSQEIFIDIPDVDYVYYSQIKLYKINSRLILIDYCTNENTHLNLSFLEIEYNENNKPINIKLLSEKKYLNINEIKDSIYSLDCFDENKIIVTTTTENSFFVFKKNDENEFYLDNKTNIQRIDKFKIFQYFENNILVDTFNQQIIFYYEIHEYSKYKDIYVYYLGFHIYDYNYKLKKVIHYKDVTNKNNWFANFNIKLKILNKENYIAFYSNVFIIISAKNLQIITIYKMNHEFHPLFVLSNSNRLFLLLDTRNLYGRKKKYLLYFYKFYRNRLIYVGKKPYIKDEIIDIREINEKGDHILVKNNKIKFQLSKYSKSRKEISRIFYIKNISNENNLNIKKDYSMLDNDKYKDEEEETFYYYNDNDDYYGDYIYDYLDDTYYFYADNCFGCYLNVYFNNSGWHYMERKEDKHKIKIKYNNKKKRKYINFRDLKFKNKCRKNKSKKVNLNKLEIEDEEIDNYYDEDYL